jgi:hypothetical protein
MSEANIGEAHPLYNACVGYMVSEKSKTGAWEQVASYVQVCMDKGYTRQQVEDEFSVIEEQVKAAFAVKSLPSSWRSAKTTALQAMAASVVLVAGGKVVGKTAVSKAIKAALTTKPEPFDRIMGHLSAAASYFYAIENGAISEAQHLSVVSLLDNLRLRAFAKSGKV